MRSKCGFALGLFLSLAAGQALAQGKVATNPAEGCRAVGLFVFDVGATPLKIVVVPKKLAVSYPATADTDREICFSVVLVGGDKNDKFEQLKLKAFDGVKGRNGKPLFKEKKVHGTSADLISLEFNDVPDFDPDADGVLQDVVQTFEIEAKFKGQAVIYDPEIIIKKGG